MKKNSHLYKKWWVWAICSAVIIYIPFLINELYKADTGYITMWGASDVLNFYGSLLSFAGTVVLGALALWQNNKANDMNERLMKIENERFKLELQPYVLVTNWRLESKDIIDLILSPQKLYIQIQNSQIEELECACLSLNLANTSNSVTIVNYIDANVYHNEKFIESWSNSTANQQNSKIYIPCGEIGEISFYCSKEKMFSFLGKKISINLILENRYGERYKEIFDIVIAQLSKNSDNSWYLYISPQNYKIEKLTNNTGCTSF